MLNPKVRDAVIDGARDAASLLERAEGADPQLAEFLAGKSLLGSKTFWYPAILSGASWLATHYGLGWDPALTADLAGLVAAAVAIVTGWVTRCFTHAPIVSLLPVAAKGPVVIATIALLGLASCSLDPLIECVYGTKCPLTFSR